MEIEDKFKIQLKNNNKDSYINYINGMLCLNKDGKQITFTVHEYRDGVLQCIINKAQYIVLSYLNSFYVCSNTELKEWAKRERNGFTYKEISEEKKRILNDLPALGMQFIFKKY